MALSGGCNCWMITCECGEVNGGCVRCGTCDKCKKPIDFGKLLGPNDYKISYKFQPTIYLNQQTWSDFKEDYQI